MFLLASEWGIKGYDRCGSSWVARAWRLASSVIVGVLGVMGVRIAIQNFISGRLGSMKRSQRVSPFEWRSWTPLGPGGGGLEQVRHC